MTKFIRTTVKNNAVALGLRVISQGYAAQHAFTNTGACPSQNTFKIQVLDPEYKVLLHVAQVDCQNGLKLSGIQKVDRSHYLLKFSY